MYEWRGEVILWSFITRKIIMRSFNYSFYGLSMNSCILWKTILLLFTDVSYESLRESIHTKFSQFFNTLFYFYFTTSSEFIYSLEFLFLWCWMYARYAISPICRNRIIMGVPAKIHPNDEFNDKIMINNVYYSISSSLKLKANFVLFLFVRRSLTDII